MEYKMRKQITRQQLLKINARKTFILEGLTILCIFFCFGLILVLGNV
tara:strand:- start:2246 stop:2386 length:141 start_codon:yes stop_codon:yes gene_type:complete